MFGRTERRSLADAPSEVLRLSGTFSRPASPPARRSRPCRRMLAIKGLWEFPGSAPRFPARMECHHRACRAAPDSKTVELGGAGEPAVRARNSRNTSGFASGTKHAEATFRRARRAYRIRGRYFVTDRITFAFNRQTLAIRYVSRAMSARPHSAISVLGGHRSHWRTLARTLRRQT